MVSFAGIGADRTRSDTIQTLAKHMTNSDLCPISFSNPVTVIKPCPKIEFLFSSRIFQKILIHQFESPAILSKPLTFRKDNILASTDNPLIRRTRKITSFNRNNSYDARQLQLESRSPTNIFDRKRNSELFPRRRLSFHPNSIGVFSSFNSIPIVPNPRPLFQAYSLSSSLKRVSRQNNQPVRVISIYGSDYYENARRNGDDPIWQRFLILAFGIGINLFGGYLVFFRFCQSLSIKTLIFGIIFWAVSILFLHNSLPHIAEWDAARERQKIFPYY